VNQASANLEFACLSGVIVYKPRHPWFLTLGTRKQIKKVRDTNPANQKQRQKDSENRGYHEHEFTFNN
jgi:hypothetical protein